MVQSSPESSFYIDPNYCSFCIFTPRAHAQARGYVIGRGVYYYISARTFFYLSKYSLSDAHFSTGRLLFEFNRLQYTLAAPEVFVSSANPVILPSGYRVSIVRNTNIDQIETTPLRYCMLDTVEHTYSRQCTLHSFRLSTRGPGKVHLHAVLARCLGNTPGSTFLCCSISLQVYI